MSNVAGLEGFVEFFRGYGDSFAVLGGAACSQWLGDANLEFRNTKDIDLVLVLEAKDRKFFERLWRYLHNGGYVKWQRSDGKKVAFRFVEPMTPGYPFMIELLSRPDIIEAPRGQKILPVDPGDGLSSLSAILLDEAYYGLILENRSVTRSGLPAVTPDALLALKAKAHLNLLADKEDGKKVRERDILKHRNDVFHLAYLVDDSVSASLPEPIAEDLRRFLGLYPATDSRWEGIMQSLKETHYQPVEPTDLIGIIRTHFGL